MRETQGFSINLGKRDVERERANLIHYQIQENGDNWKNSRVNPWQQRDFSRFVCFIPAALKSERRPRSSRQHDYWIIRKSGDGDRENLGDGNVRNGDASIYPAKQKMATQVQMVTIVNPPENNPSRRFTSRQEIEVIACPILQPVTSSSLGRVSQENPVSELLPSQPLRK